MDQQAAKVYFCDLRTHGKVSLPEKLKRLVRAAGIDQIDFDNKFVAIKMHLGEPGNLSYLRPNYARAIVDVVRELGGKPFVTDCNTLYVGGRKNGLDHLDSAYENGFNPFQLGCHTVIADGIKGLDEVEVPVVGGEYVTNAKIGRALMDADIVISLTHFKGHELAGFGGAMKNIGMGGGSRAGKMEQHADGKPVVKTASCIGCGMCAKICAHNGFDFDTVETHVLPNGKEREVHVAHINHDRCVGCGRCIGQCNQDAIKPGSYSANDVLNYKIAEYTKAVVDGRPCFHVSLVIDVSPNCDCHNENDTPIVPNVGMFASFDPVALDMACIDAVNAQDALPDTVLTESVQVMEAEGGHDDIHDHDQFRLAHPDTDWRSCIQHAEKIGLGTSNYELVRVK